jgi:DNA invertase Pin-like site-specific DNA recombinase
MTKIGYARVSTLSQSADIQVEALKASGCATIRTEKVSGGSREGRDELATVLDFLRESDVVCVHKLDRLGRNTRDVLNLVHEIHAKGAHLEVLEPAISTDGPMGQLIITVFGMVGEMELGFIKERQRAGIEKAKERGAYNGRPKTLDYERVLEMKNSGIGATDIAKELGCSRAAVYKILKAAQPLPKIL